MVLTANIQDLLLMSNYWAQRGMFKNPPKPQLTVRPAALGGDPNATTTTTFGDDFDADELAEMMRQHNGR